MRFIQFLAVALAVPASVQAQSKPTHENFADKPYMGWSSWSLIRGKPTAEKIKAQADALVANHLDQLGYVYVNIDDGWTRSFDEHGIPAPDLNAFPGGMEEMARYMHAHGL